MKLLLKSLFILAVFLNFPTIASAADYYISPSGSDSNSGSSTLPWKTIQKAANLVNPGDTVYLKGGTYYQYTRFERGGSSSSGVTFTTQNGEIAVLDGSLVAPNPPDPWAGRNGVVAIYTNYLTFKNIEITKSAVQGIVLYGSYNIFDHVTSHDNYLNGLGANGSYNTFIYTKFYNNLGDSSENAGNVDGFAFSTGSNNTVRYSEAYNNSDDGFDFWQSKNNLIEYCISHDNGWGLNNTHGDGNGFKLGGNDGAGGTAGGNNTVRNNVAYGNWFNGFDTNYGAGNLLYNNTGYLNYRGGVGGDFRTYSFSNTLKNNISYNNRNDLENPYISNNNTWDLSISDPKFISTDSTSPLFLRLQAASSVIDRGVNLGLPFNGTAPDLGAYEYSPAINPAPKPGDADGNQNVDAADMYMWLNGYIKNLTGIINGDFDGIGGINGKDYQIWINNYGK
jgi:hypothetical protein